MSCREEDALAGVAVDEPELACEVVASHPVTVLRACYVPEVVARHLSLEGEFAGTHVDDGDAGGILLGARRSPVVGGGKRLEALDGLLLTLVDGAVTDDGNNELVGADDGLMGNPVVLGLAVDGAQPCAVGIAHPRALGRLAARLPAEDDLAGVPGVALNVAHLEVDGYDGFGLAGSEVHLADATGPCAHVPRTEVRGYGLGYGHLAGILG